MTPEDVLKKEILYKAKHRGTKELDHLIGEFVDTVLNSISEEEKRQLLHILNEDDVYIFHLIHTPPPDLSAILLRLKRYLTTRGQFEDQ